MNPVGVQVFSGGEILVTSRAAQHAMRIGIRAAQREARRDGMAALPAVWWELEAALVEAARRYGDGTAVGREPDEPRTLTPSRYVTTAEAAHMLGTSPRAVRALCERGTLEAVHRKRTWYIPVESVYDRLEQQGDEQ